MQTFTVYCEGAIIANVEAKSPEEARAIVANDYPQFHVQDIVEQENSYQDYELYQ